VKEFRISDSVTWTDTLDVIVVYETVQNLILKLQGPGRDLWLNLASNPETELQSHHNELILQLTELGIIEKI
jgi:hypothetical protein